MLVKSSIEKKKSAKPRLLSSLPQGRRLIHPIGPIPAYRQAGVLPPHFLHRRQGQFLRRPEDFFASPKDEFVCLFAD